MKDDKSGFIKTAMKMDGNHLIININLITLFIIV